MKRFLLFSGLEAKTGGDELLAQWQAQADSWIWLDLQDEPADTERDLLDRFFGLDELDITEAQRQRHPPTYRASERYLFALFKPLDAESHGLDFGTLQLALFAGVRFLVSRHSAHSPYLERLWQHAQTNPGDAPSPLSLLVPIARRITDRYGAVLLDLEARLDEIEERLLSSNSEALLQELVTYNTQLRTMRRIVAYHVHVFDALRQDAGVSKAPNLHRELSDIHAVMERFSSLADLYQNVITDLIEGYISLNSHRLNQIMKVLTIVTVVFVPLTLLVGIYGMNFENMPELKSSHGYYILLTVMGAISVGLLALFRRLRWI